MGLIQITNQVKICQVFFVCLFILRDKFYKAVSYPTKSLEGDLENIKGNHPEIK